MNFVLNYTCVDLYLLTLFPLVRYSPIRGQPASLKTEI